MSDENNLVHMKIKHVETEQNFQNSRLDNLADDVRRIANIQLPNLSNEIRATNNNISSLAGLLKLREDNLNIKIDSIMKIQNGIMWSGIVFVASVVSYLLFHG